MHVVSAIERGLNLAASFITLGGLFLAVLRVGPSAAELAEAAAGLSYGLRIVVFFLVEGLLALGFAWGHVWVARVGRSSSSALFAVGVSIVAMLSAWVSCFNVQALLVLPTYPLASFAAGGVVCSFAALVVTALHLESKSAVDHTLTAATVCWQSVLFGVMVAALLLQIGGWQDAWLDALIGGALALAPIALVRSHF